MIETSIARLAASFQDDEVVYLAGSSGESLELTSALTDPGVAVARALFVTSFVPGINTTCLARPGNGSRMAVFFMQRSLNAALAQGRVDFRSLSYFGIHRYLTDPATRIDTAVIQVAPPDDHGSCSLGPAVEFMPSIMARVRRIIGIVNPNVPVLPGSASIPMDAFAAVARSTAPLATYDVGAATAGPLVAHLAPLIPDGATLQIGLGKIPAQLLNALGQRRNLKLHTGMIGDAALNLLAAGALCNGESIVTGVAVGSSRLYEQLARVRGLKFAEVGFTHAPQTLARASRFHAVNSALEIDLLGQVNAETLGGRYVSGPGGLPDFARAAHLDPEGSSIIAMNATDATGAASRIVAKFAEGTPVTVPQHDVDAVVTEYGVAMLRGQSMDERARRLCAVAHPSHRHLLQRAAREIGR
jgi:4-hydroxybutyrate CoA-transferase